ALVSHPFGEALAIEPEPENFLTLRLNVLLNGLEDRTTVIRAAVSNVVGEADLVVDPSESGKHWVAVDRSLAKSPDARTHVVAVPALTLDSLVEAGTLEPERLGMIWIDAQGHEGQILEGAVRSATRG